MMRSLQKSDMEEIRRLYDESNLQDGWPDFDEMTEAQVIVEEGKIVAVAATRMVPEMVLILGKGHPAIRLYWLKLLYGKMLEFLRERGLKRAIAFVPPQIERAYARRLFQLGFQPGLSTFVFLAEEEDEQRKRD
jgi:hypothetical protein